jgi:hypothetical protein
MGNSSEDFFPMRTDYICGDYIFGGIYKNTEYDTKEIGRESE